MKRFWNEVVNVPFADIAALLSIGNINQGFAIITDDQLLDFQFIDSFVRVDPDERFTLITEDSVFNVVVPLKLG